MGNYTYKVCTCVSNICLLLGFTCIPHPPAVHRLSIKILHCTYSSVLSGELCQVREQINCWIFLELVDKLEWSLFDDTYLWTRYNMKLWHLWWSVVQLSLSLKGALGVAVSIWFACLSSESTRSFGRELSCASAIEWSNSLSGARQLSWT